MHAYHPLTSRGSLGSARICRPDSSQEQVTLDSPAVHVMTDLTKVPAAVIDPQASMDFAHAVMVRRGVRMLIAVTAGETIAGIVTATDLLGEKPVALVRDRRIKHSDILVADLMTPASRLDAFDFKSLRSARVGHIVSSLQQARRHHALVVQEGDDGTVEVRGIFSLTQIARQLGMPLELPQSVDSFAEIEAALAAG